MRRREVTVGRVLYRAHANLGRLALRLPDETAGKVIRIDAWVIRSIKRPPRPRGYARGPATAPKRAYLTRRTRFTWHPRTGWASSVSQFDRDSFVADEPPHYATSEIQALRHLRRELQQPPDDFDRALMAEDPPAWDRYVEARDAALVKIRRMIAARKNR